MKVSIKVNIEFNYPDEWVIDWETLKKMSDEDIKKSFEERLKPYLENFLNDEDVITHNLNNSINFEEIKIS